MAGSSLGRPVDEARGTVVTVGKTPEPMAVVPVPVAVPVAAGVRQWAVE